MSEVEKRSLSDRIGSHLWILLAFVPYLNGTGLIYVGSKASKNSWVIEGSIYEIPWIIYFLLAVINPNNKLNIIFVIFGVILEIISIIRSIKINSQYQAIIDNGNYRKSKKKFQTFVGGILSIIPFINGMGLIYLGNKHSETTLTILGILFECTWILALIFKNNIFSSLAIGSILLSLISFIYINYNNSKLSYEVRPANKPVYQPKEETKKETPKQEEIKAPKPVEKNTENWRELFYNNDYEEEIIEDPYEKYEIKTEDLTKDFDEKERKVTEIIEKRFEKSITYDRFMEIILESHDTFYREKDAITGLIELAKEEDMNLEKEIREKIIILEKIIKKINELILELLRNTNKSEDEDLDMLFNEMEDITKSVKDYV